MPLVERVCTSLLCAGLCTAATAAFASQGPGVGPGAASPAARWMALAIIAALGATLLFGFVRLLLGLGPIGGEPTRMHDTYQG
jgi:hypothetical protein